MNDTPSRLVDVTDLVDRAAIAAEYGVTTATVGNWARYPDFPGPVHERHRLYLMAEVRVWMATRQQREAALVDHGTDKRWRRGCRCEPCRAAASELAARERADRARRLKAGTILVTHGRHSTYNNYGCRCEPCVKANSAKSREYKRQRREAS